MSTTLKGQDWLDTIAYPFEHKYMQLDVGKMHYVDEGEGEIILFVHGTPAWSFLYRDLISELSNNNRCLAIDHMGFGLSDKPDDFDGTPQSHSENLIAFIEKLDLKNITLVVHDFGGPIGLSSAIRCNDRIKQVVVFNTWLWETEKNPEVQKVDKILQSKMGEFLYLRLNFSPKFLLKKGFYEKKNLSKEVHKQYINPFPNKASRVSLLNLGKSLAGSSDWYQQQWEQLDKIDDKPWLFLWGTKDDFISLDYLEKWKGRIENAKIKELECGHFVQEEKTKESIQEIKIFMNENRK